MSEPWLILERRYGDGDRNPSPEVLALAIRELFVENLPGMTEADYEEHGAGSLRYGYDEGPMYVITVTRGGMVIFEEWADQDYETPLHPERKMESVSPESALELWTLLADGEVGKVRDHAWEDL